MNTTTTGRIRAEDMQRALEALNAANTAIASITQSADSMLPNWAWRLACKTRADINEALGLLNRAAVVALEVVP